MVSGVDWIMAEIVRLPCLEPSRVRQVEDSVRSQNSSESAGFLVWRWIVLAGWLRHLRVGPDGSPPPQPHDEAGRKGVLLRARGIFRWWFARS